jgi:hypothetical protein
VCRNFISNTENKQRNTLEFEAQEGKESADEELKTSSVKPKVVSKSSFKSPTLKSLKLDQLKE